MTSIDPDHVDGAETGRLYRLASDRRARAWVGTVTILATLVAAAGNSGNLKSAPAAEPSQTSLRCSP